MSTLPILVEKDAVFLGHKDCVYSLDFISSDKKILSASGDGMVVKWDIDHPENGELIAKVPNSVYAIKYINDSNQLLIGQNFEGIHLIDMANNQELKSIKLTSTYIFDIQTFENLIFVACGDGQIHIVDMDSFTKVKTITASNKSARTIAINPQVKEFAVGFSDFYVRTYSLTDFSLKKEWLAHANSVFSLQFTNDLKYLVSTGRDASIKIWDTWNHYELQQSIVAHMYAINSIAFSPDGLKFATGSMDKTVKIWDATTWRLLKVLDKSRHAGHGTSVNKVIWFDNQYLVSGSDDKTVSLWKIN